MDDRQLSQFVRDLYPVVPTTLDPAHIERRALQLSGRRRARRAIVGAAALMVVVVGVAILASNDRPRLRPADSTTPQSTQVTTMTSTVTSTTVTSTTVTSTTPPTNEGTPLLGATIDPGAVPRFVNTDPAWTFTAFDETTDSTSGGTRSTLLLVGDGPFWDAPRIAISVGATTQFDREDASTLSPVQEFEVAGLPGRYREVSSVKGGLEFTWALPDGSAVWAASTGLTTDEAMAVLALMKFDGTTATIEAPPGFSVVTSAPPSDGPTFQIYEFTGEVAQFYVECSYGAGMLGSHLAFQPTESVEVAGTEVGVRLSAMEAGPDGPTPLSASIFKVGSWHCQTMLTPPIAVGSTPPPSEWASEDEIRTLLGSLTLVNEDTFRDIVAPLPTPQISGFSFT